MPNRNSSESSPEYQEMMAGRSLHKGFIDLSAEPHPDAQKQMPQQESSQLPLKVAPTFGDHVREWAWHLFGDRSE